MQGLAGHREDLGSYPEVGRSPGRLWAEEGDWPLPTLSSKNLKPIKSGNN